MPRKNAAVATTPTAQDHIQSLINVRDQIRDLNKKIDELKAIKADLEETVFGVLDDAGLTLMSSAAGTVSISEREVAAVEDWDAYHKWIRKNDALYLLQRRVNDTAYRELMEQRKGRKIPGVNTVKVRTLNLRQK